MTKFKLSKTSLNNIKDVRSDIIELVKRSLEKSEHDFGIPTDGGKRTAQQQNNLFHKRPKVTQLDGFKKKSYHQSGKAVDIFIYDEHGACWNCISKYKDVAKIMKAEFLLMKEEGKFKGENLEWGGDWTRFKDYPHFQIK
ncbi:D-alanyl-D-alanine carboxypeptidase [Cellulophaga phage phi19:2]|uniref:D-alanyl-D-alanine carboxypeptidase n=3 Tax=Cellulophaga phage phiST TaxID=756282 RepID=M4SKA4_9CAUD|nr:endolysin [Cellulophaga phage phiST]AGH56772.1 hypothetical protein CGPG_00074 [Cellulophaga phage phiST]AGO47172.1 D-alanyl-D-alanine carboxypeptidase [Cellulophaga phage phiST]AGO48668.1 D-alanyl-D-alanine carboxypeptidase [Cellulophaga phage phi19:2]AGO49038.1 D-alanyl-D-alanine carboxypeptidase [Cellulophaga phage phi13:1]